MALQPEFEFTEIHFVILPYQGNVYSLSPMRMIGGESKILLASLKRYICITEYSTRSNQLGPYSREVHFTYIPGGAEIISIDSFNKSKTSNDFVVGITFSKDGEQPAVQYFNIYTDWEPREEFSLESLAQSCLSLELNFIPYKLHHAELTKADGETEIVWLLSGSDNQVHLYREEKNQHAFSECATTDHFPEFADLPSIVLTMDIMELKDGKRVTAFGCEDGYVRVTVVDVHKGEIKSSCKIQHDSLISCVKLFTVRSRVPPPDFLPKDAVNAEIEDSDGEVHLLVCSTFEVAVIYWNILEKEFADQRSLPQSENFDSVQCGCVADVNMDGRNEILLGTYGQELLVYKIRSTASGGSYAWSGNFELAWRRKFAHPLLQIEYLDVTGDGMKEIVVLSTRGLHVLQHNTYTVAKLLEQRLAALKKTLNLTSEMEGSVEVAETSL